MKVIIFLHKLNERNSCIYKHNLSIENIFTPKVSATFFFKDEFIIRSTIYVKKSFKKIAGYENNFV